MSRTTDSPRWCAHCRSYGDHHTDMCPNDPNGFLSKTAEQRQMSAIFDQRVRISGADRTVHGQTDDGREIVRYDRAGKWYVESRYDGRKQISLREAVKLAVAGTVDIGRPGGVKFDAKVHKLTRRSERSARR